MATKVTERKMKDGSIEKIIHGIVVGKPDVKTIITLHGSFTKSTIKSEGGRHDFYSYLPESVLGNCFLLKERYSRRPDGSLEQMPYLQSLKVAEHPGLFSKDARRYSVDNRVFYSKKRSKR